MGEHATIVELDSREPAKERRSVVGERFGWASGAADASY
jgi:hypothetical protein